MRPWLPLAGRCSQRAMACDLPAELLARDVAWAIGWDRRRALRFFQKLGIATKRGARWVVSGEALAAQLPEAADAWRRRG